VEKRPACRRPTVPAEVCALVRTMSKVNPLWGAPRIHGELLKLGFDVSQATVAKYMVRHRQPPSQTWRTFLRNHIGQIAAADFFVVPTATCRLLFVLVILAHERRLVIHLGVTDHPTAAWTAQQLREGFPWNDAPRYLVRDRDAAFHAWATTAKAMDIHEVVTAARSPWQNAYAERLIGSIRRECLDHVIVWNERGLRRLLHMYIAYYSRSRTHLSLKKDAPISRHVASPADGDIVAIPQVGGLHHRYEPRRVRQTALESNRDVSSFGRRATRCATSLHAAELCLLSLVGRYERSRCAASGFANAEAPRRDNSNG
jgi:transposase InsO family protein